MGAPGLTYFCEYGHIVLDIPHHYIMDVPDRCPYCGSAKIKSELEWQDPDYGPDRVPHVKVCFEKKRKTCYCAVYDVTELFRTPQEG